MKMADYIKKELPWLDVDNSICVTNSQTLENAVLLLPSDSAPFVYMNRRLQEIGTQSHGFYKNNDSRPRRHRSTTSLKHTHRLQTLQVKALKYHLRPLKTLSTYFLSLSSMSTNTTNTTIIKKVEATFEFTPRFESTTQQFSATDFFPFSHRSTSSTDLTISPNETNYSIPPVPTRTSTPIYQSNPKTPPPSCISIPLPSETKPQYLKMLSSSHHSKNKDHDRKKDREQDPNPRTQRPIRLRVRSTCHHCGIMFGSARECTGCGHRKCEICPRTEARREEGGGGGEQ